MIFLHSSFRTSSTWMFDRFRKLDGVTAYCEIFNEVLATIKRSQISALSYRSWYSKHTPGAEYLLEFMPLIANCGGVDKFDLSMAYSRFIPENGINGNISEFERSYIASLIDHAGSLGKLPVLTCTRSLGRLRAIKADFPGFHVLIYRNLFRQWCSYTEQYARGNRSFFDTIRVCIDQSCHDKFFNFLKDAFPFDDGAIDSDNYFCAFALLHIYIYGQVADAADMIFDVEKAICDEEYRKLAEAEIKETSGLAIDFSNIKGSIGFSFLDRNRSIDLKERIRIMSDIALSLAPSETGRQFASKTLADFMEEWEKYEFYAGALSVFAGPRGLLGERDTLAAEREALLEQRDSLFAEIALRDAKSTKRKLRAKVGARLRALLSLLRSPWATGAPVAGGVHIKS